MNARQSSHERWLTGCRIVVTRPKEQSETLCERLSALGADPITFPVIAIAPPQAGGALDQAIAHLEVYDWIIFTSVNGVEHFWNRLTSLKGQSAALTGSGYRGKVAAIGPATAAALEERGTPVQLMPDEYRAEAILECIGQVKDLHILLPRADIARPTLADGLQAQGAHVDETPAYHTVLANPTPEDFAILKKGADILTFTSSSTARNFVTLTAGLDYGNPQIACIGPVTAATARELGLRVDAVAQEYTIEGLIHSLSRLWPLYK